MRRQYLRFGRWLPMLLLTLAVFGPWTPTARAQDQAAALQAARAPGAHLLMRHALAPGVGDPAGFRLADCRSQRNLNADGRRQAQRIGDRLRAAGIAVERVLSSQWCRCRDTAVLLGLGEVEDSPLINSFFRDASTREAQTAGVLDLLRRLDAAGAKAMLVTHQVNITALTGVFPASGEILVVRLEGRRLRTLARIKTAAY